MHGAAWRPPLQYTPVALMCWTQHFSGPRPASGPPESRHEGKIFYSQNLIVPKRLANTSADRAATRATRQATKKSGRTHRRSGSILSRRIPIRTWDRSRFRWKCSRRREYRRDTRVLACRKNKDLKRSATRLVKGSTDGKNIFDHRRHEHPRGRKIRS